MSNLTIEELPTEIIDLATTPEGMERARAAVVAAFSEEAERLASLARGIAQADAGDTLPLEESRARGRAELDRLIAQRTEPSVPSASEESLLSEEEKETS